MAQSNFSGPVASAGGFTGDVTGTVTVPSYTFASLPATPTAGAIVLCTDAGVGSNEVILCYGDGTDWLRVDTGAAVTSGV